MTQPTKSKIGKIRICSSCTHDYREWKEQDIEGHMCPRCTIWVLRKEIKSIHKSIDLLCGILSPDKSEELRRFPFYQQRYIVNEAFKEGILSWHIN